VPIVNISKPLTEVKVRAAIFYGRVSSSFSLAKFSSLTRAFSLIVPGNFFQKTAMPREIVFNTETTGLDPAPLGTAW
jgi:DNA polymerase III epsilon subunit-like protein